MNKTIEILRENDVNNYTIEHNRLIVNDNLYLSSLKEVHKDFLKDTTINGDLYLFSLKEVHKDFLKGVAINGNLYLSSLTEVHKDFLKKTTINGNLYLSSLTEVHKNFLKGVTINGLYLSSLTEVHKDFLKDTTINGFLSLNSLKEVHKDFLKKTTINGFLDLDSLKEVHKDFLKDTTINGDLYLSSLTEVHKDFLKGVTINGYLYCNSLMMQEGYNKEIDFCYFDGILSKVHNVRKNGDYTYYKVHNGYVVQKGDTTAYGKTLRESYNDLQFKLNKDKLLEEYKSLDICKEFIHNELREIHKNITGFCNFGIDNFIKNNDISNIKTINDVISITSKLNEYKANEFKEFFNLNCNSNERDIINE